MDNFVSIDADKIDWNKLLSGREPVQGGSGFEPSTIEPSKVEPVEQVEIRGSGEEKKKRMPRRRNIKKETLLPHSPIITRTKRLHLLNNEKAR
jgi:hypothetical protein